MSDLLTQGILTIVIILIAMFSLLVLLIVYLTNPIDKNGNFSSSRINFSKDFEEELEKFEEEEQRKGRERDEITSYRVVRYSSEEEKRDEQLK